MSESLFTDQVPTTATNATDGTPGISTATTIAFAVAGTVSGIRFYATTDGGSSAIYTVQLWELSSNVTGTMIAEKGRRSDEFVSAGGGWFVLSFDSPVAVSTGLNYRAVLHSGASGRYVATNNFWTSSGPAGPSAPGLTNGNLYGPYDGQTINGSQIGQGTFRVDASTVTMPSLTSASPASYFIDVVFDAAGSATPGKYFMSFFS